MINIKNKIYKLLLLDTNILSELQRDINLYHNFLKYFFIDNNDYIVCYEPYVLLELKRCPDLYLSFKENFKDIPALLIKRSDIIIKEVLKENQNVDIYITDLNNPEKHNFSTIFKFFDEDKFINTDLENIEKIADVTAKGWAIQRKKFKKISIGYTNQCINKFFNSPI